MADKYQDLNVQSADRIEYNYKWRVGDYQVSGIPYDRESVDVEIIDGNTEQVEINVTKHSALWKPTGSSDFRVSSNSFMFLLEMDKCSLRYSFRGEKHERDENNEILTRSKVDGFFDLYFALGNMSDYIVSQHIKESGSVILEKNIGGYNYFKDDIRTMVFSYYADGNPDPLNIGITFGENVLEIKLNNTDRLGSLSMLQKTSVLYAAVSEIGRIILDLLLEYKKKDSIRWEES